MSALDDVKASVSKLSTDLAAFVASNAAGATVADLVSLKASIDAIDSTVLPAAPPAA